MKEKKIKKIIIGILCFIIILITFFFGYFNAEFSSSMVHFDYHAYDYYKAENYYTSNKDLFFSMEYYRDDYDKSMLEKKRFELVGDNVKKINNDIKKFFEELYEEDKSIIIDFDYNLISSDDYYRTILYDNSVSLDYYDFSENLLYIFEFPKEDKEIEK